MDNIEDEKGQILVVDDNRLNRIKLKRNLEQQGFGVGLAEDGESALANIKTGSFDVMLLDIIMPGMDGYEVLEIVNGNRKMAAEKLGVHRNTLLAKLNSKT